MKNMKELRGWGKRYGGSKDVVSTVEEVYHLGQDHLVDKDMIRKINGMNCLTSCCSKCFMFLIFVAFVVFLSFFLTDKSVGTM